MDEQKLVLIVDDEPDTVTYFQNLLEDHGYTTMVAKDGEEGMARIREKLPALVTLDVTMPNMSGTRFYRSMREDETLSKVPIIVITGVSKEYEHFISSRRNVPAPEGFLSKPIEQDKFLSMVESLVQA